MMRTVCITTRERGNEKKIAAFVEKFKGVGGQV